MRNFLIIIGLLFSNLLLSQEDDSTGITKELSSNDIPIMFTKEMPYYSSCEEFSDKERNKCTFKKIHESISSNYKFPKKSKKKEQEGTTYVRFIVNRKGKITKVEVLKSSSYKLLDIAAIKAVKKIPDLIPGKNEDGNPVSIVYTVPVKVNLR
tara:strand:+ start:718 stop:1176 length:459 start_codon:yes stop_codon:yes gene_type:complete